MSFHYSPKIVNDGLVLYFDAANSRSYITGTTWYDITRGGNNGGFNSQPNFNSSNLGSLNFNGTQYCTFYAPNLISTTTVEMWAKKGVLDNKMMFGWFNYDVWYYAGALGFNTFNSDMYGLSSTQVTELGLLNNWKHYVFEMRSDVAYTNNKIYINGVSQSLSQIMASENSGNRNFNSGNGAIASQLFDFGYIADMDCAIFKVYNRALTESQVLQNFNSLKGRFGII